MRPCLAKALLLAVVAVAATAGAQEPAAPPDLVTRAKQHYEAARALYALGKFEAALVEFEEGYRLAPRASFLVNMAQCHRQLGRLGEARTLYEKFLAATPADDPMRADVQQILAALPREGAAPPVVVAPPAPPAPPRAWSRDPAGAALLAVGLASAASGVALLTWAGVAIARADDDYESFLAARGAPEARIAGAVLTAAGGALVAGAIARYVIVRRAPPAIRVGVTPLAGGGALAAWGRF